MNQKELAVMNKTAVVTGGTKGIGKAIIKKFAENDFNIITCARNTGDLASLQQELHQEYPSVDVLVKEADLSQKAAADDFTAFILANTSRVDVLINNTGTFIPGEISTEPDGHLEKMINTNLYSAYHLTRGLLPIMMKAGSGDIVNICSIASIMPYANGGSYSISKYAMLGMTKVLREEMKQHGIRVMAVLPGATYTSSWEGAEIPETRFMKAEDVADAVFGACALSRNSVVEEVLIRPAEGDL